VGLQAERLPNAKDCRLVQPRGLGHQTRAPVRRLTRPALQRRGDHLLHLRVGDLARLARARGIEQSVQPLLDKAAAPLAYRLYRHATTLRNLPIGRPLCTRQHDARPQRKRLRGGATPRPFQQPIVLFGRERQLRQCPSRNHVRLLVMTLT